jgi:hypothetical protein
MFVYYCTLTVHFNMPIASFAVLADTTSHWKPNAYTQSALECEANLKYQMVKLLDYSVDELEASDNPFASLVLAHLKTQETQGDAKTRFQWKMRVVRSLYERGFSEKWVRDLFHLVDWIMALPEKLEEKVEEEVVRIEKEKSMPFVTGIERKALERGQKIGEARGESRGKAQGMLIATIDIRFGISQRDKAMIGKIHDLEALESLTRLARNADTIAEIRTALKQAANKTE